MSTTQINIHTDSSLKNQAQAVFDDLGLDMTTAFNLFLRQVVYREAIPFEIAKPKLINPNAPKNEDAEEARKKETLRRLYGSCKDPTMVEPTVSPCKLKAYSR